MMRRNHLISYTQAVEDKGALFAHSPFQNQCIRHLPLPEVWHSLLLGSREGSGYNRTTLLGGGGGSVGQQEF